MISNLIKVSVVAAALALGGSAVANNNGGTQSTQQQTQQQVQPEQGQQTQQTQQQGMNDNIKSVRLGALDQQQIRDLQTRLQSFGFYQGKIDGVLGQNTRSALVSYFQSQVSMVQQGRLSDQAMMGFGFSQNDIERVRGVDNNNNNTNNNNNNDRQNTRGQQ